MSVLLLRKVTKSYATRVLLDEVDLRIEAGERVGLVGLNGSGKTSLLRVIDGTEDADSGEVALQKGATVGSVPQIPTFGPGVTVRRYVEDGMATSLALRDEAEAVAARMEGAEGERLDKLIREHARLQDRLDALGAWDLERRAATILSGIGLPEIFWDREGDSLSGGEKSRAALARALSGGHDLLLLDEPTNHLDLDGIEWLESFLQTLPSAVLLVSHDRRLLDRSVDVIVDLEQRRLDRYPGHYDDFLTRKRERYEQALRDYRSQQDMIRREQQLISKLIGGSRAAVAKNKRSRLAQVERLEEPHLDVRRPVIRAPQLERGGELVLEADGIAAKVGERTLFEDVSLRLGRGQRVGIVGPNGAGKSTLLRILAGRRAADAGVVKTGHKARCGYFDQESGDLPDDATPFVVIKRVREEWIDVEVRGWLARFLFRGDDVDKRVASLSGGERARLSMAWMLAQEPSWLALDEPTNHLDLAGRTALEEMLGAFAGALVFVSHDRAFLDALCTDVLVVGGDVREPGADGARGARWFKGNYSMWRERQVEERDARRATAAARAKAAPAQGATDRASPAAPDRVRNPYKFQELEERIMTLEAEIEELEAAAASEEVFRDPTRARDVAKATDAKRAELREAYDTWENW